MPSTDKAADQLVDYSSELHNQPSVVLRHSNGAPVDSLTASMTAGPRGPIVLKDFTLIDHLAHFDRERIPERVVHAKGAGAFGYFETTTEALRDVCKAELFQQIGKQTPVGVRFSTVGGESGSADTARDPRGFAIKFYTDQGNWDLVGNNTPIFFLRDPILFPSFIHTQKRNPQTHLPDHTAFWDFMGHRPETVHQTTFLFSDRGTPDGYRHMNGYGSHTFKNVNSRGEPFYVKYHFKTDQGIANLAAEDAERLASEDPNYATRDLYNAIAGGCFPSWTLYVQVMTFEEAARVPFHPFDLTKVWPHSQFPLREVGRLVLDRNPKDYFTEVEQIAFSPSHMIPGIEPSPDKMLQGRLFSYPDTHRHRLGANYAESIPVNRPLSTACSSIHHYQRDGPMQTTANGAGGPNYFPNSFSGPQPTKEGSWHKDNLSNNDQVERLDTGDEDNFSQAGHFYRTILDEAARERLTDNIAGHMRHVSSSFVRQRAIDNFSKVDPDYGRRLKLKLDALLRRPDRSRAIFPRATAPLNPPRTVLSLSRKIDDRRRCPYGYSSKL